MLRNLGECNSSEESAMTVTTNIVIKLCHERHERDGTKKKYKILILMISLPHFDGGGYAMLPFHKTG